MDFKDIATILFTGKCTIVNKNTKESSTYTYNDLSDDDKEQHFFIINRFLAKKYPKQSQYFNNRNTDKATAFDIWNLTIKKERTIPFWFWKGPTKRKEPDIKDWKILYNELNHELDINDMFTLCELYPELVKKEIKVLNDIKKEREKI